MNPALLVDEVLRLIFEIALDHGKSSLCSAARSCRAWKDPALDCIWRRLPSAVPLLSLLPGFALENGNIRFESTTQDMTLTTFRLYAIRVKHVTYCHRLLVDLTSFAIQLFKHMGNLESVRIESRAVGDLALHMCLAPQLRSLTLRVGYTKSSPNSTTVDDMMSYLDACDSLQQLSVRGHLSECLHLPLSRITTLRSLSLHLSSLTEQSFMTVSTFPFLADFDVHADRLSLSNTTPHCDTPFFPALEKLKIRAQPTLVASILGRLPSCMLRSLHIDAITPGSVSAFDGLFKAMSPFPLLHLTLEHSVSVDDSEDIPAHAPDEYFSLDHLRPLSKAPLRSLILDVSLPSDLSDAAIETMSTWWPRLERLQLGAYTTLEHADAMWTPKTSLAGLVTLAKACTRLESLVIALDLGIDVPLDASWTASSHPLASLLISSRARPDVASLSVMLSRLFPSLVDVTSGFVGDHEDVWDAIQTNLIRGT